jgi:hypothetical protein
MDGWMDWGIHTIISSSGINIDTSSSTSSSSTSSSGSSSSDLEIHKSHKVMYRQTDGTNKKEEETDGEAPHNPNPLLLSFLCQIAPFLYCVRVVRVFLPLSALPPPPLFTIND